MSKHIILVRHAHSLDAALGQEDHDRVLSAHGEQEASLLAAYLRTHKLIPDKILCSTAARTRATASILEQEAGFSSSARQILPALYHADAQQLHQHLDLLEDALHCVMIIAHNPSISEWGCLLATTREKDKVPYTLPTAGMVHFLSSASVWKEVSLHQCRLMHLFDPSLS